jgi:SNF2 family DNA or RNA helicase
MLGGLKYLRDNTLLPSVQEISNIDFKQTVDTLYSKLKKSPTTETETTNASDDQNLSKGKPIIAGFIEKTVEKHSNTLSDPNTNTTTETNTPPVKQEPTPKIILPTNPKEVYLNKYNITLKTNYINDNDYLRKCASCHGKDGSGFQYGEELYGGGIIHLSEQEIYNALIAYKRGERQDEDMQKITKDMDVKEMRKYIKKLEEIK